MRRCPQRTIRTAWNGCPSTLPGGLEPEDAGMKNTDLTRLADVVLGEAVVALLSTEDGISADTVARHLRVMASGETSPERREAIALALGEVQTEFIQSREGRDAAVLAFAALTGSGSERKK